MSIERPGTRQSVAPRAPVPPEVPGEGPVAWPSRDFGWTSFHGHCRHLGMEQGEATRWPGMSTQPALCRGGGEWAAEASQTKGWILVKGRLCVTGGGAGRSLCDTAHLAAEPFNRWGRTQKGAAGPSGQLQSTRPASNQPHGQKQLDRSAPSGLLQQDVGTTLLREPVKCSPTHPKQQQFDCNWGVFSHYSYSIIITF